MSSKQTICNVVSERRLLESVTPKNTTHGFLGTVGEKSKTLLPKAILLLRNHAVHNTKDSFKPSDDVAMSHFLDSPGGRHLGNLMLKGQTDPASTKTALSKTIGEFMKAYKPELFATEALQNEPGAGTFHAVYANANSLAARMLAAKRRAADAAAREALLKSQGKTIIKPPADEDKTRAEKAAEAAAAKRKEIQAKTAARKAEAVKVRQAATGNAGINSSNSIKRDKAIGEIRKLIREPLPARIASQKLAPHIDDVALHDQLNKFKELNPNADVRPVIKQHIRRFHPTITKGFN